MVLNGVNLICFVRIHKQTTNFFPTDLDMKHWHCLLSTQASNSWKNKQNQSVEAALGAEHLLHMSTETTAAMALGKGLVYCPGSAALKHNDKVWSLLLANS